LEQLFYVGVKVPSHFYFPQYYARVTACGSNEFFLQKKTASSRNTVLAAMSKLHYNDFQKLASTYSTSCLNASNTDIQMAIWCHLIIYSVMFYL